jgi:EmrB/QacA subfamily drug resistance transporter
VTSLDKRELTTRPARSTKAQWWVLVIIACAQLMIVLDSTIMIIALPSAQRSLGFSDTERQWVITAYTLAFGGFLLLGGRISDMLGPRRTLMAGVIGFALASALGGAAPDTVVLIAARGLQGLCGALLAPSVLSLLQATFTNPRERARAFGIYATIAIGGSAFGLILGGLLTQYADWRWCLYVNLPIAAVVMFGIATMIPKSAGRSGVRLDVAGVILGCGGLVALVYGLGQAGSDGWASRGVLVPLAIALVLLAGFVVWQSHGPNPLLPLRVLRDRNRSGAYLTILLAMTAMFGTFVSLTYLFQSVDGYSPLRSGIAFLPLMVLNGLASTQLAGRLMPHVPTRLLIVPGLLAAAVGVALLTRLTPDAAFATRVLPTEILLGLGLGIAMVPVISTATSNADPGDVGVISAMSTTSQQIGASIGTALLNTIAASAATSYVASHRGGDAVHATVHGYATTSAWAAGILALAALVAGVFINVHPGRAHATQAAHHEPGEGGPVTAQPSPDAALVPAARGEHVLTAGDLTEV